VKIILGNIRRKRLPNPLLSPLRWVSPTLPRRLKKIQNTGISNRAENQSGREKVKFTAGSSESREFRFIVFLPGAGAQEISQTKEKPKNKTQP
jgi:hypothetical protein